MCRVLVTLDPTSKEVTTRQHGGTCVNATWFDRDGDTVIVCAHPDGDIGRGPAFERTFSVAAWDAMTAAMAAETR